MSAAFTIVEYEVMFRQQYRFLNLIAFRIVRDEAVSEDIVQDFFLNLWQRRDEISITTNFQSYASRAVRNLSISYLRKQQLLSDEQLGSIPDDTDPIDEKELFLPANTITSRVMEVVEKLPEERKKIFLLHVVDRLSYAQIAEMNNISLNTVKTQMKRAYAFVREQVAGDALGIILLSIWFR